jgi:hypothetical protein
LRFYARKAVDDRRISHALTLKANALVESKDMR